MAKQKPKTQDAYLHDMLEAATLVRGYMAGVAFEDFWENSEKRDAVALRISVIGESAYRIDGATEKVLPAVPFKELRGMRNRIAHDYGSVDFRIVWEVTQTDIEPLVNALGLYFEGRSAQVLPKISPVGRPKTPLAPL
jgi:uncharacterized protein with HEPN domain